MIKVYNRSTGMVYYSLPELGIRRAFNLGEIKNIDEKELEALSQIDGGLILLKENLLVDDKDWVEKHFEAPIEYWWKPEKIKKAMLEDSLELFSETLDYAPEGVLDFIKMFSWQVPLTDLNKIAVLKEKTGFDAQAAALLMKKNNTESEQAPTRRKRLREEENND